MADQPRPHPNAKPRPLAELVRLLHDGGSFTTRELKVLLTHYEAVSEAASSNPDYRLMAADAAVRASSIRGYINARESRHG